MGMNMNIKSNVMVMIIAGNLLNYVDAAVVGFGMGIPLDVGNEPADLVSSTWGATPVPTAISSTPIKVLQGDVQVTLLEPAVEGNVQLTPTLMFGLPVSMGGEEDVCSAQKSIIWVPTSISPSMEVEGNACFLSNGRMFCGFKSQGNELLIPLLLLAEHENRISMDEFCPSQEVRCRLMGNDPDMRDLIHHLGQQIDEGELVIHVEGISESALGENNSLLDTIIARLALCGSSRGQEYYVARISGTLEIEGELEEIGEGDIVRKDLISDIKLKKLPIPPQIYFAIEPTIAFNDMAKEYAMGYEEFRNNPTLAMEKVRELFCQVARENGPYELAQEPFILQIEDIEYDVRPGDLVWRGLLQAQPSPSPSPSPSWWKRAWNAAHFWRR